MMHPPDGDLIMGSLSALSIHLWMLGLLLLLPSASTLSAAFALIHQAQPSWRSSVTPAAVSKVHTSLRICPPNRRDCRGFVDRTCSTGVIVSGRRPWRNSGQELMAAAETEPDAIDLDIETQLEAERIMAQLESENERAGAVRDDGSPKYMPSTSDDDPIVRALKTVLKCKDVTDWELLDSRWNGNEALRWTTDRGAFFVKMNRVEDLSVFMSEAVSLSALAKANVMQVPKPLHLGKLPRVGDIGPGAFMILEHLALVPFGPMRPGNQAALGNSLADLHLSKEHEGLHKGRFGFPVSNFLALTPLNNAWCATWTEFFTRRISDQIDGLLKVMPLIQYLGAVRNVPNVCPEARMRIVDRMAMFGHAVIACAFLPRYGQDKAYGRAALVAGEADTQAMLTRLRAVEETIASVFEGVDVTPSLLHGDLWIGNTGATLEGPCMFDPASFFGHSEFELAIMDMFGGFQEPFWTAYHAKIPKGDGFERRQKLYKLYHYLNQLNLFGDPSVRKTVDEILDEILGTR